MSRRLVLLSLALVPRASSALSVAQGGRGRAIGRGRPPSRGRGLTQKAGAALTAGARNGAPSGAPSGGGDRKARKAAETERMRALTEKKLASEARFFWEMVHKHSSGGDITGSSGASWPKRDAHTLFGGSGSNGGSMEGIDFEQYEAIPVSRSGAGEAVAPLTDFRLLDMLPESVSRNLLDSDRMG